MGPRFAGVLGLIALSVTLLRNGLLGIDLGSTIVTGVVYLIGFALLGWFIGSVAAHVIKESVRDSLIRELERREAEKSLKMASANASNNVNDSISR